VHDYDDAGRRTWTCGPSLEPITTPIDRLSPPTCATPGIEPDVQTEYDADGRVSWVTVPGLA
jgi:hypothetical protein